MSGRGRKSSDYEVGYGRPPIATRFAAGNGGLGGFLGADLGCDPCDLLFAGASTAGRQDGVGQASRSPGSAYHETCLG
jgi:hypothetical protein